MDRSVGTRLTEEQVAAVVSELEAAKRDREGIAMYVMLEDRSGEPSDQRAREAHPASPPAELIDHYRTMLLAGQVKPDEYAIARVLEVLAAAHFTLDD